jgi:hypothetical protein
MTESDDLRARTRECEELKIKVAVLEERSNQENEALLVARKEIDRRLEGMNELRDQINSERGSYATKEFAEATRTQMATIDRRVQAIENTDSANRRFIAIAVGCATFIISLVVAVANNLI